MRIAVDAANNGGGQAPGGSLGPLVRAAAQEAARGGHSVLFVGTRNALEAELKLAGLHDDGTVAIADAPSVISPEEDPQAACREKPDASILRAAELVAAGEADVLVSTSPPAAAAAGAAWHVKRLRGVLKPMLACSLPAPRGPVLLADAGTNVEAKPWHLLQFAVMGALYAECVLGIETPRIGLAAGSACGPGLSDLLRETLPLLKYSRLAFAGPLDGGDILAGKADVVVTDGATGDILLRYHDALSSAHFEMLESEANANLVLKAGSLVMRSAFGRVSRTLGSAMSGGAPILGLGAPTVVCRCPGSGESVAIAIRTAVALAASDIQRRIRDRLEDVKSDMEYARAA